MTQLLFAVNRAAVLLVLLIQLGTSANAAEPIATSDRIPSLARPIALTYLTHNQRLLVANRDSATLTTIDPASKTVEATWKVPQAETLADLIVSRDEQLVLTCSSTLNRVWLLKRLDKGQFAVLQVMDVPVGPVGLAWLPTQNQVAVSCQWSRRVLILNVAADAAEGARLTTCHSISVQHAPRRLLPVDNGRRLIVADQFSGILSVIQVAEGQLERTVKIPGQNIHGLTLSPDGDKVIIAHQILNQIAETSKDAVFWGIVMSNTIRMIPLKNLLDPQRETLMEADIYFLGTPHHGAADPTSVAVGVDETMLTTLGGVDELAIGLYLDHSFDRVKVGRHPVAVTTDTKGTLAFVANQFSDSISIIEVASRKNLGEVALHGPQKPRLATLVERGEALFHDGKLSLDGWYSCHSCHSSGHTVGLLNDNFGDGNYGAPKRIPSLLGIDDTAPFLWSGKNGDLGLQTRKSITSTMHGDEPTDAQVEELVAYMRTLSPPPRIPPSDIAQVARGAALFEAHDCGRCHTPPTYTSAETYDVGIKDQNGRTTFNPPSLRGVRHRSPYFHDHRATTLSEVFTKHQHPKDTRWNESELADLLAFLESL